MCIRDSPKPAPWEVNQAANTQCGETIGGSYTSSKVSQPISTAESMVYEIARRGEDARTQQVRAKQALDFFEANPAFVEFVDLLKNGVITVSYTHLDVYKRQAIGNAKFGE